MSVSSMGQCCRAAAIASDGRVLVLRPGDFGGSRKLAEHSWVGGEFVNAAYSLIFKSPKQLAWIGDCACDEHGGRGEAHALAMPPNQFQKFHDAAWRGD
jgi:hypothetical protein